MKCAAVIEIQELEGFVGRYDGDRGKAARRVCRGNGAVGGRGSVHAGASLDWCTGVSHVEAVVDKAVVGTERDVGVAQS